MSKKNTKVKRIFALLMAVLIAVTYMPNPLYAYAEDYMDDDQVTAPSDEYVEETLQDEETIELDGDAEVQDDSVKKVLTETETESTVEDADVPVSDDTAVDTETDDTEEPSGETSEGTVEDGREPLDDKVDLTEVTTDTESQVVTKETETEAETISYPSHFFKEEAGGVKVAVSAPEGALPEGTTMEVTPILAEDVEEAVSEAVSDKVKSINAVDITFKNAEGQEIEPLIPVSVTLNVPGMNRKATKEIVHIDDEGMATTVDYIPVANTGASLFESDQFSVYVVVETGEDARLAVNFVKADGSSVQMLITPNQISHIEQYIYDPGVGELPAGEIFEGWTQDPDYNASTPKKTIADVRQDVIAELQDGVTEGDSMTFYPMIFKSYTVTYLDEHSIKIKTDQMLVRADGEAPTYEVSESYTPYPTGETGVVAEFIGWQQILPEVPGETVMYQNGDSFTMEESAYTLKAITQKGHWLMFEENLNNAPYTQPQFVALGGTAQEPANPVRTGYTFDGWWTADDSSARDGQVAGERFNFSTPLTANTIVYAKWNKATHASYSVVIWQQNKEGTGYDYSGTTITVNNATVGSNTYTISAQGTGNDRYARIYGRNNNQNQYTDYSYSESNFDWLRGFHLSTTAGDNNQGFDNPTKVAPEGNTVINVYYDRNMITYRFRYSQNNILTFNGLYGSAFTQWPDPGNGKVWRYPYNGPNYYTLPLPITEFNPAAVDPDSNETTFTFGPQSSDANYTLTVYFQTETGSWDFISDEYNITAPLSGGYDAKWYPTETYTGFEINSYYVGNTVNQYTSWTNCTNDSTIRYGNRNLNLRYTRNKYNVYYNDGVFVDGNGTAVDGVVPRTNFDHVDNVYYEANISGATYNKTPEYDGFVFLGWYDNALCAGEPYTFNKMPAHNVSLYAKWGLNEYAIKLHPNDSTSDPITYNNPDQPAVFYVDEGDNVGNVGGERIYYDLVGWYVDEEFTRAFDFDAIRINKANIQTYGTLYTADQINPQYRTTIGELNLYAKWRSKLIGAEGIQIEYNYNGGTGSTADESFYVDQAEALAGSAVTPADPANYVFSHWEVQHWNGTEYVSSGVDVFPGGTFTVLASDAKITDQNGNPVAPTALDSTKQYTYTVQLKAIYVEKDKEVKTHIYWFNNYDGGKVAENNNIKINEAVPIPNAPTREGYVFKGWIRGIEEDGPTTNLTDLWLVYTGSGYTYNGNPATQVAADELLVGNGSQHHALYAKWEPILQVRITGNTGSKVYNGAEQSLTGYTVEYKVGDQDWTTTVPDGVTVALASGATAEAKGTDVGNYPMGLEEDDFTVTITGEYTYYPDAEDSLTVTDGWLEITPLNVTVTINGNKGENDYDGESHTTTGYTVSASDPLYLESYIAFTGTASATRTDAGTTPMGLAVSQFSNTNSNFNATFIVNDGHQKINPIDVVVEIAGNTATNVYDGASHTVRGYRVVSISNPLYHAGDIGSFVTKSATRTNVVEGTDTGGRTYMGYTANSFYNGNPNFANVTFVVTDGWQEITPRTVTVAVQDKTVEYNGSEQYGYSEYVFSNVVDNQTATIGYTPSSGTLVGTYDNGVYANDFKVVDASGNDVTSNYTLGTQTKGKLIITDRTEKYEITVVANSNTGNVYDGTEKAATGFETLTFTVEGNTYTVEGLTTSDPSSANVCNIPNTISGTAIVRDAAGNDVTSQFNVNKTNGNLEITKRQVTVSVPDATKQYNGSVQYGYTNLSFSNVVTGQTANIGYTPSSGTLVGTYDNGSFADDFKVVDGEGNDVTANYELTSETAGKLTITDREVKLEITVVANSNIGNVYDGQSHAATGFETLTFTVEGNTYTVEGLTTSDPSSVNVCDVANAISGTAVVRDASGNDVTGQFDVHTVDGRLEIVPAEIEITVIGENETTVYDGNNHVAMGFTATANNPLYDTSKVKMYRFGNYTTEVIPTAERTIVGQTMMGIREEAVLNGTPGYVPRNTDPNFTVTAWHITDGYVKIMARSVTVSVPDKTVEYNGSEQYGNTNYTFANLAAGHTATITYTPSHGTLVGTYDNGAYAEDFKVVDGEGNDVTSNYDLTKETKGKLIITDRTTKYEITVVANSNTGNVYDGQSHAAIGFETLAFTVEGNTYTVEGLTTSDPSSVNVCDVANAISGTAVVRDADGNDVTAQFDVNTVDGRLEITKAPLTITADSNHKEYDGTALIDDGWQDTAPVGLKGTDTVTSVTVTGSQTEVGSSDNTPSNAIVMNGEIDVTANYDITYTPGTLEVTQSTKALVITSSTKSWVYDGELHTDEVYTVTYDGATVAADSTGKVFTLPTGDIVTITATAAGVKYVADTAANNNTYTYVLTNANQYKSVTATYGTLSITKAPLTITADSNHKEYDGTALIDDGWQDTAPAGLKGEDTVTSVTVTGSQTEVGSSANTASGAVIKNGETDVTANYEITYTPGTLTVTKSSKALVITSSTKSWVYDGELHTDEVYTVTYDGAAVEADSTGKVFTLPTGDTVTITATAEGVKYVADTAANNNTYEYVLTHADQYGSVSTTYGTLSITKAPLTITADSNEKEYDGTALTDDGWQDTAPVGLKGTDTVTSVTVEGSQTEVGSSANTASGAVVMNGDTDVTANYDITYIPGTLVVTQSGKALVITSSTKSWTYDGELHTDEVYTVTYGGTAATADETGKVFTLSTGDTVTITATAEGVKYVSDNEAENNTYTYVLTNATQYKSITATYGTLSITQAPLTITADSDQKEYDGTALTDDGWQDTAPVGLQGTDTVTSVTVTGSQTEVGTSDNTASNAVVMNGDTNVTANYNITYVPGTLEVTQSTKALVITSSTKSWTYDGDLHKDEVYTVTYDGAAVTADATGKVFTLPTGDTVTITATAEGVKYVSDNEAENNTYNYVLTNADQYSSVTATYGTLSINKASLTITADSNQKEYDGTALTDDGWMDTEPVGLQGTDTVTSVTVTGSQTEVGTSANTASNAVIKNGTTDVTENYEITYAPGTLEVTQSTKALVITSSTKSWVYDGELHTDEVYTVTYDGATVTSDSTGKVFTLPTGDTVTITATAEGVKYVADTAANNNTYTYVLTHATQYKSVTATYGTLSITKAPLTITADSNHKEYDGTALIDDGWQDTAPSGLQGDDEVTSVTVTGSQTEVGTSANTASNAVIKNGTTDVTENYNITYVPGTLEVTQSTKALVITSSTKSWVYDGELHTDEVYTVTYDGAAVAADSTGKVFTLPTGDTVTITATAEGVKYVADTAANNNTYTYVLTHANQYKSVTATYGTLSITKAPLTITADSNHKEYDGTALIDDGWQDTAPSGLQGDDEVTSVTVTGSQTEVGSSANTASGAVVKNGETDVTANYEITYTPGTLTVTQSSKAVVITSSTKSWTYDGELHKDEVYTVTYGGTAVEADETGKVFTLPTGDTITITATASGVKYVADTAAENNTYTYVLTHADQYSSVTATYGTLSITKAPLTITADSNEKEYDGTALTDNGWQDTAPSGLQGDDEVTSVTVTGSQTEVGSSANTASGAVVMNGETDVTANYDITYVPGTLVVTQSGKALVITSSTKSWTYDGEVHTDEVYTVTYGGVAATADATGKVFTLSTGDTVTITATAAGVKYVSDTAAENNTYTYVLTNATQYKSVTATYGTLSITQAPLTITADSNSKEYDGTELTDNGWQDTAPSGLKGTDAVTSVTVTGSQTEVGSSANTASGAVVMNGETDVTANYDITYVPGTLIVTQSSKALVITSSTKSWTYDGELHTDEVYTVTYDGTAVTADSTGKVFTLPTGDTVTITATAEGVKYVADTAANNNTYTYVLTNEGQYSSVTATFGTLSITQAPLTITADSNSKPYDGTELTDNGWQDTAPVGLKGDDAVASVTVTGSQTEVGSSANTPSDAVVMNGSTNVTANYDITYVPGTLTITQNTKALVITSSTKSWTYDGELHTDEVYTVTYDGTAVTADSTGKVFTLPTGDTVTITATAEGVKYVADTAANNNTYTYVLANANQYSNVSATFGTLSITQAPLTITADSNSKEYDGTALTDDGWQDTAPSGLQGTDAVTSVTVTGSQTKVGSSDNTPSNAIVMNGEIDVTANYDITYTPGTLEVTASTKELKVVSADGSWTYDGTAHTKYEYTVTYGTERGTATLNAETGKYEYKLSTGDIVTITPAAAAKITHVAESDVTNAFDYTVEHSDQYANKAKTEGKLSITPAPVTVTTGSASKPYDGTALLGSTALIEGENVAAMITGLVNGETATVTATGTITEVGTTSNIYDIVWGTAVESDYDVTDDLGTLEITTNDAKIVLTAPSDSKTYDSTPLTCDGTGEKKVTATGLPEGFTWTATASGSQTNVGSSPNVVNNGYKFFDQNGNDKTANFTNVTKTSGLLTVSPKAVTITANDADKPYDGTPLTEGGFTSTPLEAGDSHTFTVTMTADSTITDVGTQPNVIATVDGVAVSADAATAVGNYMVTIVAGELEITQDTQAIVITSADHSWTYDSKLHKDETYTVTYGGQTVTAGEDGKTFTLPNGDVLTITATAAGVTNVSDNANNNNTYIYTVTRGTVDTSGNYESITANVGTLTINPKTVTITANDADKAYDGQPLTEGGFTNTPLETGDDHVFVVTMTADSTITDVGTQPNVIATVDGVAVTTGQATAVGNYLVTTAEGTLTITQDEAEFVIKSADHTWTYDSKLHKDETYTVTYMGTEVAAGTDGKTFTLPNGDVLTITATAAGVTNVSDNAADNNTFTYVVKRGDVVTTGNYKNVVINIGDLVIAPKEVTITANDADKPYDGTPLTEGGYSNTPLEEGDEHVFAVTMTADSTITDVGTQPNVIATVDGVAVTTGQQTAIGNYLVTTVNGTLEITKNQAEIVISSASNEWTYDGENHTDETYTVTYNGEVIEPEEDGVTFILPNGDVIVITPTAEGVTDVADNAEDNNTFTYTVMRGDVDTSGNYENLTADPGTLTIDPRPVTVIADDKTKVYGTADPELTATEDGVVEGDTLEYELYRDRGENVGSYNISFTYPTDNEPQPAGWFQKLFRAFEPHTQTVVQGNYEIKFIDGEFDITPMPLTITAASDEKVYDGTPLTNSNYTATALAEGDTLTSVTVTGSQTEVGSSPNTPSDAKITNAAGEDMTGNYDITYVKGALVVTPAPVNPPKPPKTGDDNHPWGWAGLAGLAMAGLAVLFATRKREEESR